MSEAWQNTDGQQATRGYNGGNPTFGSRNFNNSNFNRGPRRDNAMNGGGYQGMLRLFLCVYIYVCVCTSIPDTIEFYKFSFFLTMF